MVKKNPLKSKLVSAEKSILELSAKIKLYSGPEKERYEKLLQKSILKKNEVLIEIQKLLLEKVSLQLNNFLIFTKTPNVVYTNVNQFGIDADNEYFWEHLRTRICNTYLGRDIPLVMSENEGKEIIEKKFFKQFQANLEKRLLIKLAHHTSYNERNGISFYTHFTFSNV